MVTSREAFANSSTSTDTLNKNNIQTIDSNPDILWGVLERGLADQDSEELTPLTKRNGDDSSRNLNDCISSPPPVTNE